MQRRHHLGPFRRLYPLHLLTSNAHRFEARSRRPDRAIHLLSTFEVAGARFQVRFPKVSLPLRYPLRLERLALSVIVENIHVSQSTENVTDSQSMQVYLCK